MFMSDFKKYLNTYEFDCELPSGMKLKIKPIVAGQLKKLLIYEGEKDQAIIEEALDGLISGSVITEGFDIGKLYIQDRLFLLLELRKISKGNTYEFTFICPKCKSQTPIVVDINEFPVKKYNTNEVDHTIVINENISIVFDHPTRADQAEAFGSIPIVDGEKNAVRLANIGWYSTAKSIKSIITPDGADKNSSMEDKLFLLDSLTENQFKKIKDWFVDNDFGISLKMRVKCIKKDYDKIQEVKLDNVFL